MKTILVPTDFSSAAMNAADYAVSFAKEIKANVLLFHAYKIPLLSATDASLLDLTPEELQKDNEKLLMIESARLKRKSAVKITCKTSMGLAVDEIVKEEEGVDFIVMGMTGAGRLSEMILGSVTTAALKKIKTPVIVVPEKIKYKRPEHIALASDYTLINENALEGLKELINLFNSKIYIVNIKQRTEEASVERTVAELNLETQLNNSEHFYYFPKHEDLVDGMNEFVKMKKVDMIALVPHRYMLIERLFHSSFTKKMAFHTHLPLLVLPDNLKKSDVYFG